MALFLEKTAVEWHPNASLMGAVTHWPELIRDGNWRCDWNADTVLVLCQVGTAPTEKWYRKGLEAATRSCRAARSLCAGIVLASLLCCVRVQKWDEAFIAKQPWKWYALSIYKPTSLGPLSDCHQSSSHSSGSFVTILTQKCWVFFLFIFNGKACRTHQLSRSFSSEATLNSAAFSRGGGLFRLKEVLPALSLLPLVQSALKQSPAYSKNQLQWASGLGHTAGPALCQRPLQLPAPVELVCELIFVSVHELH